MPIGSADAAAMEALLHEIQATLYAQAGTYLKDHTYTAGSLEEFEKLMEQGGLIWAPWDGTVESARAIKDKTKATIRLLPEKPESVQGKKDLISGNDATTMALFAKAY
jgi:prolyl-tRNA synthetase